MRRRFSALVVAAMVATATPALTTSAAAQTATDSVVISQVYGGGGNSGAQYTHDFVEVFNAGSATADLSGWSIQYTSAAGNSWGNQTTALDGELAPGAYHLVQLAAGAGNGVPLPTADSTGSTNMSATSGKVALASSTSALPADVCPTGPTVVDFVGFGNNANCFEGEGAAPQLSNTLAALPRRRRVHRHR
jgi:uncharacterized protein